MTVIKRIGHRLQIVLRRHEVEDPPASEPSAASHPPGHETEFVAYSDDCLLSGRLRISTDRLTDMLNQHDEYLLVDVLLERLTDGGAVEVKEVLVARDELLLVHATGPRGSAARRHRTRLHPVAIQVGPYNIRGYLHSLPGTDPILHMRRRETMVPLTDAWIEYQSGLVQQRRRVGAVVVNREQIDWIVPAEDDQVEMPDLPLKTDQGPLLKDFTGALFDN